MCIVHSSLVFLFKMSQPNSTLKKQNGLLNLGESIQAYLICFSFIVHSVMDRGKG
jgi:hypothetical protein